MARVAPSMSARAAPMHFFYFYHSHHHQQHQQHLVSDDVRGGGGTSHAPVPQELLSSFGETDVRSVGQ